MKKIPILILIVGSFTLTQVQAWSVSTQLNDSIKPLKAYNYIINSGWLVYDANFKKVPDEQSLKGTFVSFQHPQLIDKLGLFKNVYSPIWWVPTEGVAIYYSIWKINFSDGKTWDVIKVQGLYFIYYDSKYYLLPTLSWTELSLVQRWQTGIKSLSEDVIIDQEDKFLNILKDLYIVPKEIHFFKNNKEYKLVYQWKVDNYGITGLVRMKDLSEQIGKDLYREFRTTEPNFDEETQKNIVSLKTSSKVSGDISDSYSGTLLNQLNVFKADGLYLKLTDNQYAVYALDVFPKTGKDEVYVNMKNGKKIPLSSYLHTIVRGCSQVHDGWYLSLLKPSYSFWWNSGTLTKDDFKVIGDIQGTPIFGFKDKNNPYLKWMYKYTVRRWNPAYSQFVDSTPVLVWIDPFGRTVISTLIRYFGGDVLDECIW